MNRKKLTIKDIALKANVSKSTVSRVLNDTTPVNEIKRQAVLDAMKELNFKPNVFARSLAGGKSMTIGIITGGTGSPFYESIAKAVIAALNPTNYTAIIVDGQWQERLERNAITTLVERQVDGLLAIGAALDIEAFNELDTSIPLVMVGRKAPGRVCLNIDNKKAAKDAIQHLIDLGHTRIAHIMGKSNHPDAIMRYAGYKEAMTQAGLAVPGDLFAQGDFTYGSGKIAAETMLDSGATMTAVFAANDQMALGARLAFYQRGIKVPDDVSIIGFDNQPISEFSIPPLTTIAQPGLAMGRAAAKMLLDIINEMPAETPDFSGELIVRASTCRLK